jgi:ATP-binding protein involved in chromosome partitioning
MPVTPRDIRREDADTLVIDWDDGVTTRYAVRELRLECPCAGCRDEVTGVRLLDPAKVPAGVRPLRLQSVGNYALKISWSDGHDTGIYTFDRLRRIAEAR